jgi:uncharacterized protein YcbK (DUF882 family)
MRRVGAIYSIIQPLELSIEGIGRMTSRRLFLRLSGVAALGLAGLPVLARASASAHERVLGFYNTHTGERVRATYWADGSYLASELVAIDRVLRDHRSGETVAIDRRLFDILYDLQMASESRADFHVISGYRSPATNAALRRHSSGVARGSLHTLGKAIDIRLPGRDLAELHRTALALRAGGVGYYPRDAFLHLDTGRFRTW